jgi:hypothetical protein
MRAAWWSTLGLSLDILGALLLGAEAVTLQRVMRWREGLLRSRRRLLFALTPIPRGVATDRASSVANVGLWFLLITVAYLVEAVALKRGFGTSPEAIARDVIGGSGLVARALRFAVLLVVGGIGMALASLAVIVVLASVATGLARGLLWVDDRTPGGTVGVSGLFVLILGFVGQLVAAWV